MNFAEFQAGVRRTWKVEETALTQWQKEVVFCETGVSGETGELSEMIKKGIFHGIPELLDPQKVKKELGDILYYATMMADLFGLTIEEVAEANQAKLRARYPDGFVKGGGIRTGEGE
jgi:NTP pyrophosphatase (non-canonical NTP hydrolase)